MTKNEYYRILKLTWSVLLECNISELPVKVSSICKHYNIALIKYTAANDNYKTAVEYHVGVKSDGFAIKKQNRYLIFYNDMCNSGRCRFTIAHELGHILLGHVPRNGLVNREPSSNDDPIEQAANMFAARLLAPACVLYGCRVRTHEEISSLCNISLQSARYRSERMNELRKRKKFFTIKTERLVYEQFEDYIKKNKLKGLKRLFF